MKKRNLLAISMLVAIALLGSTPLQALTTVLNWDADGGAGIGGTGAWDTTSTVWNTTTSGAANTIWTTGSGNSGFAANFDGTAVTGGTVTFSGLINDGASTIGVDKIGADTVILSRAAGNTFDGVVNVVDGTLLVTNTSGSSTGA